MATKYTTAKFDLDSPFSARWMIDGVANSAQKGILTSQTQVADFLAQALEIHEAEDSTGDVAQAKLGKLAGYIEEREAQVIDFERYRDAAAEEFHKLTGSLWRPYVAGKSVTPKSKTVTAAFFKKRFA
jgi:hypothetical protein